MGPHPPVRTIEPRQAIDNMQPSESPRSPAAVPVFDNHFHLDPQGGVENSVREFVRAGGTGMLVVHKPYGDSPRFNRTLADHAAAFRTTLELAQRVRTAFPELSLAVALAPHPAEFTKMVEAGYSLAEADAVYRDGLELAARHVANGEADALGEIGRPHWTPVAPEIWDAANAQMELAFSLAKERGCPAIIHCEQGTPEVFADLARHCDHVGLPRHRAVKHFSPPIVDEADNHGLFPSVLVGKSAAETAIRGGTRWVMETDFMDDPRYPGAVLGPKTVPKRTHALLQTGALSAEQAFILHGENPRALYGIDVPAGRPLQR
jgi:TatD-related deoxyribonuclease